MPPGWSTRSLTPCSIISPDQVRTGCVRQDDDIARLILINGPPGVGKSTIARRYLDGHPLTLLIEIDDLRVSLGGWVKHEESKLLARRLALALAGAHLVAGHDVVVPQFLGRTDFIDALKAATSTVGSSFSHIVLMDDVTAMVERFEHRRRQLTASGLAHPQAEVAETDVRAVVAEAVDRLEQMAVVRTDMRVVDMSRELWRPLRSGPDRP